MTEVQATGSRPRLAPGGVAVGMSSPMVISFPGKSPDWSRRSTPADLVALVRAGDRLGYAYTTVCDHMIVPRRAVEAMGETWYAPVPTLAFIAGVTERIGLCTHVLVLPYRHPVQAARDLSTLDHLSGGRLILGVGTGHLRPEFSALGLDHASRGATTDAHLAEIKRIWHGETDFVVSPPPVQRPHPRIWAGGNTARALRRALEAGDGWVPWFVDLAEMRRLLDSSGHPGEVVYPGSFDPLGVAGPAWSSDRSLDELARLRAAGITAVTAGFPSRSLAELIAQLEAFAGVLPHAAALG